MSKMPRVALVNMPFNTIGRPSLQLALLQAILAARGIPAKSHYLNLDFAARIGWEDYESLSWSDLPHPEWLFSTAAFGERAPKADGYREAYAKDLDRIETRLGRGHDYLRHLREREAPAFLDWCLDAVPWHEYDVVGFTSTFHQNCAALGLARRLKERHPSLVTVFGGANFEDEMGVEYVRAFSFIDYAVIGEGDEAFPSLLERIGSGQSAAGVPGVACREGETVQFGGRAPQVRDMDALPAPDFTDYFAARAALQVPEIVHGSGVTLLYESSRGCWWGAKHHCTFCGVNGLGMAYRSKSPARVLAMIDELATRYDCRRFEAVDNILDHRYVNEVFRPLAEQRKGYDFFYEVKANLTQAQIRTLAEAGLSHFQPGIESLSTHVLKLMDKGASGIQNVRCLKWAEAYGIGVTWFLLVGFPGERAEDYERQMEAVKLIPHLHPPGLAARIWVMRFTPYFDRAEQYGISNLRPEPIYGYLYPDYVDLSRIAYYFAYDAADTLPPETHDTLREHVAWWKTVRKSARPPVLRCAVDGERLTILDARKPGSQTVYTFYGVETLVHEYCSTTYHTAKAVLEHLHTQHGMHTDLAEVQRALDMFVDLGLVMREDGYYLSLAVPVQAAKRPLFDAVVSLQLGAPAREPETAPAAA